MSKFIVITSINNITKAVKKFSELENWKIILIGDKKSPQINLNDYSNITYLSVENQLKLKYKLLKFCPYNHYSRKNLGYLYAMERGAKVIADSDDDNIPYAEWGANVSFNCRSIDVIKFPQVVNIYKYFTNEHIWPRGLPISRILPVNEQEIIIRSTENIGIWQSLADIEPDVDAIYRLVLGKQIKFKNRGPIALGRGVYCPFNSQNTIWRKETFPYLYLPQTISFRFTDILRSYIAQRGLWENGYKVAFCSASVYQERNDHNLMKDFLDEIPCYTQIDKVIKLLTDLILSDNPYDNLINTYKLFYDAGIVQRWEIEGATAWLEDIKCMT